MRTHGHFANLPTSKRLLKLLNFLRVKLWPSTIEISRHTGLTNPARDISELRKNGKDVVCRYDGKSKNGNRIYRFRLLEHGRKIEY